MRNKNPPCPPFTKGEHKLEVVFLTTQALDATRVQKTLSHVYPGIVVSPIADEKQAVLKRPNCFIIDTTLLDGAPLEHFLEITSNIPAVLIVDDLAKLRGLKDTLGSRRTVVARKDLDGMGLIQSIHHLFERQKLHDQLQKTSSHLKELSIRDDLTHLFNHKHLDDILDTEVKKANRYKRQLGLVIIAIKNFTAINENFGHYEGDKILAKTAELVKAAVREVDITARYGDNEFAIILPESDEKAASIVASRVQQAISLITLSDTSALAELVTCCGIAALSPSITTKEELIHTALAALLEAKRNSHNAICTSGGMLAGKQMLTENRALLGQLSEKMEFISSDAEKNHFQTVIRALGEYSSFKKYILPHSERVAFFAGRLAEHIGLDEDASRILYRAGLLHDAGKLCIDPAILAKPEKLNTQEMELIRKHPVLAMQMIGSSPFLTAEIPAIVHHHERCDGKGYPDGLSGDKIPLHAKILAIAEAWDVMITPQTYRIEPVSLDLAIEELRKSAGEQFDEELVEKFMGLITG